MYEPCENCNSTEADFVRYDAETKKPIYECKNCFCYCWEDGSLVKAYKTK